MLPHVSFLLPVYNEREHLGECLQSIAAQDYPADRMEVLLAEGGSTDGTAEIIAEFRQRHPQIALQVIANPARNTAVGRNLALAAATGELVLNFSGHAVADRRLVSVLVQKLMEQPLDVAGVGCAIRHADSQSTVGRAIAAALRSPLGGGGMDSSFQAAADCDARSLAFCLYRRDAVGECGGFDPQFWCGQDAELNLRLAQAGKRLRFTPDTYVVHHKRPTLRRLARQMYQYGAARAAIARKHRGSLRPVFLLPTFWIFGWLALLIGSLLSSTLSLVTAGLAIWFIVLGSFSAAVAGAGLAGVVLGPLIYAIVYTAYGLGFLRICVPSPAR